MSNLQRVAVNTGVPGDIAQPGVGQRIVDAAAERFGRVDTGGNDAGIFIPSRSRLHRRGL